MPGETYIPKKLLVCTYVWGNIHTQKIIGVYVCLGKHTYLETRGMYVKGMYVCLGKHTYLENDTYVCMYVWGNIHTIHT